MFDQLTLLYCPIRPATTLRQALEVDVVAVAPNVICLVLSNWYWPTKSSSGQPAHPEPIVPLFRAVVTVMAKWLYIQP